MRIRIMRSLCIFRVRALWIVRSRCILRVGTCPPLWYSRDCYGVNQSPVHAVHYHTEIEGQRPPQEVRAHNHCRPSGRDTVRSEHDQGDEGVAAQRDRVTVHEHEERAGDPAVRSHQQGDAADQAGYGEHHAVLVHPLFSLLPDVAAVGAGFAVTVVRPASVVQLRVAPVHGDLSDGGDGGHEGDGQEEAAQAAGAGVESTTAAALVDVREKMTHDQATTTTDSRL